MHGLKPAKRAQPGRQSAKDLLDSLGSANPPGLYLLSPRVGHWTFLIRIEPPSLASETYLADGSRSRTSLFPFRKGRKRK